MFVIHDVVGSPNVQFVHPFSPLRYVARPVYRGDVFVSCLLCVYESIIDGESYYMQWSHSQAQGSQDETTPVHELMLAFGGIVITLVVGPFLLYHMYLVS